MLQFQTSISHRFHKKAIINEIYVVKTHNKYQFTNITPANN